MKERQTMTQKNYFRNTGVINQKFSSKFVCYISCWFIVNSIYNLYLISCPNYRATYLRMKVPIQVLSEIDFSIVNVF